MSDTQNMKRVDAEKAGSVPTRQEIIQLVDFAVGSRPEAFIDFVEALQDAARATSSHLEENHQDDRTAARWARLATSLEKVRITYGLHAREMGLRT